ncbi:MAG: hypothetical protein AB1705_23125, partial [Verrucomicrobiota bacterium]
MQIKIVCPCGTRFAFDVEPVDGQMPTPVACPRCGADATGQANEQIHGAMVYVPVGAAQPAPVAMPAPVAIPPPVAVPVAVAPAPVALPPSESTPSAEPPKKPGLSVRRTHATPQPAPAAGAP